MHIVDTPLCGYCKEENGTPIHLLINVQSQHLNPSDTKGFGTTSDTKGGATPLLSHNSLDLGT